MVSLFFPAFSIPPFVRVFPIDHSFSCWQWADHSKVDKGRNLINTGQQESRLIAPHSICPCSFFQILVVIVLRIVLDGQKVDAVHHETARLRERDFLLLTNESSRSMMSDTEMSEIVCHHTQYLYFDRKKGKKMSMLGQ